MSEEQKPKTILQALLAAQAEFPEIPKDRENTYFHSRYSTLDAIFSTCRPVLNRHDIFVDHFMEAVEGRWYMVARLTLVTTGDERLNRYPLAADYESLSPQAKGSEITYGRRYSLAPMLGITSDEDDDGNAANAADKEKKAASGGGQRQQRQRKEGEQKPKGGPPSGEAKPVDPVVVSQKAFVSCKNIEEFGHTIARLEKSTLLQTDLPKFTQMHKFAASHLEARCQKKEFDRDSPEVGALFDRLHSLGDRMSEVEAANKSQGEPATAATPATQQGVF